MGVFAVGGLRVGKPHLLHDLQRETSALVGGLVRVDLEGLLDLRADPHEGVQGAQRLLEHHADILAVDGAQLASGAAHQIPALKEDLPLHHDRAALDEPGEGHGGDGLAGAGFAHQAYALAVGDGEIDALDGLLAGGFEGDVQIAYLKHLRHLPVPRSKGRSPAPAG